MELASGQEERVRHTTIAAAILGVAVFAAASRGQEPVPVRPYDGIQAGYDAYQLGEERRRADIAYQLYLNDQLKYWSGIPTSRGETIYYGGGVPGYYAAGYYGNAVPVLPPADLDYTNAYGRFGPRGYVRERVWFGPRTVFEPWPYVPGDIWGYRYYSPMRQPVGQHQEQTGPNRWESHPVYDPPLPNYRPLPPVDSPLLDGTPYETPKPVIEAPLPEAPLPPAPAVVPAPPTADPPKVDAAAPDAELPAPPPKPRRPREY
jgi:hypothetical protein